MIDEKEVTAYVTMPDCFLQGCSEDIVIFRADGGNHFTDYGTVEEASEYSGIGTSKIKELSNSEDCPFVLWNGAKRLIKRKQFEEYLSSQYSL